MKGDEAKELRFRQFGRNLLHLAIDLHVEAGGSRAGCYQLKEVSSQMEQEETAKLHWQ